MNTSDMKSFRDSSHNFPNSFWTGFPRSSRTVCCSTTPAALWCGTGCPEVFSLCPSTRHSWAIFPSSTLYSVSRPLLFTTNVLRVWSQYFIYMNCLDEIYWSSSSQVLNHSRSSQPSFTRSHLSYLSLRRFFKLLVAVAKSQYCDQVSVHFVFFMRYYSILN